MPKRRLIIGIDAGRQTGIAVYDPALKSIITLKLLDFWTTVEFLEGFKDWAKGDPNLIFPSDEIEIEFEVVIEDPQLNAPTFVRKDMNFRIALSKAQDVGRVKEQSFLLIEYLTRKKVPFKISKPTQTKWDAKTFNQITKWQGASNEHTRDAGRLVFGRS